MGWLNTIASLFEREDVVQLQIPQRAVFQRWMRHVASHLGARLGFDGDGDAQLTLNMQGESREVLVMLKNGVVQVFVPSIYRFAPGRLPPIVVEFLARQNSQLE